MFHFLSLSVELKRNVQFTILFGGKKTLSTSWQKKEALLEHNRSCRKKKDIFSSAWTVTIVTQKLLYFTTDAGVSFMKT